jgi:hypothetical protein
MATPSSQAPPELPARPAASFGDAASLAAPDHPFSVRLFDAAGQGRTTRYDRAEDPALIQLRPYVGQDRNLRVRSLIRP